MDNKKIAYTILVIAALLLLIIPFILFDIGDNVNGSNHFVRFGLHVLSFFGAIFLGSLFVTGVTNAATSAATIKIAAVSAAVVVTSAVAYNAYQTTKQDYTALNAKSKSLKVERLESLLVENAIIDSSLTSQLTDSISNVQDSSENITENETSENNLDQNTVTLNKNENAGSFPLKAIKDKNKTTAQTVVKGDNTSMLDAVCHSFQVIHRAKKLDRKLGLSIYDPDKTIKLLNDCGCVIKEAPITLTREGAVVESKIQNGNFATLRTFKSINADDVVSITIEKATCKDAKGNTFLYSFPKPVLLSLIIGDHREFDTESATPTKQAKELNTNNEVKPTQKDKVEEEMNKYGN